MATAFPVPPHGPQPHGSQGSLAQMFDDQSIPLLMQPLPFEENSPGNARQMELSGISRQSSIDDFDTPQWMFGNSKLSWPDPPAPPPGAAPFVPPQPDELDRAVREAMIECLTDRVVLQKRIDVVHNGGQPEMGQSCGVAMRAMWAIPLLFAAKGASMFATPMTACCSSGVRMGSEKLKLQGDDEEGDGDGDKVSGKKADPALPFAACCAALKSREEKKEVVVLPSQGRSSIVPTSVSATTAGDAAGVPAVAADLSTAMPVDSSHVDASSSAAPPPIQAAMPQPQSTLAPTEGQSARESTAPKARPKKGGGSDSKSVMSTSSSMSQSAVGNLLAGLSQPKRKSTGAKRSSADDGGSVIGAPAPRPSASLVPAPVAKPAVGSSDGASDAGASDTGQSAASSQRPKPRAKKAPGESKTVITGTSSNSAMAGLLGPMVAKQGKKRGDDAKSAIG